MKEKNPGLSGASILTCGANAQRAGYAALPGPIPLSVSRHCRGARDSRSTGLKPVSARSGARSKCLTTRTGQDSSRNACAIPWTEPFACCSEQRPAQRRKEHCARRSPCSLPLILAFRCPLIERMVRSQLPTRRPPLGPRSDRDFTRLSRPRIRQSGTRLRMTSRSPARRCETSAAPRCWELPSLAGSMARGERWRRAD